MEIPDTMELALFWNDMPIGHAHSECHEFAPNVWAFKWTGVCLGEEVSAREPMLIWVAMAEVARAHGLKNCVIKEGYGVDELVMPKLEAVSDGPIEGIDIDVEKVVREYMEERGRH